LRQSVGPGSIAPHKHCFAQVAGRLDILTAQIHLHTARHTGIGIRRPFDTL